MIIVTKNGAVVTTKDKVNTLRTFDGSGKLASLTWKRPTDGASLRYVDVDEVAAVIDDSVDVDEQA